MQQKKVSSTIKIYDQFKELPQAIQTLFQEAEKARDKAYAPYSNYRVGAALHLASGKIVTGNNQENAAYPSGLCAERTALFYAGAQYPEDPITALVVSVKSAHKTIDHPSPPCGACRQALAEYEFKQEHPIAIYFKGEVGKIYQVDALIDLLPLAFNNSFM